MNFACVLLAFEQIINIFNFLRTVFFKIGLTDEFRYLGNGVSFVRVVTRPILSSFWPIFLKKENSVTLNQTCIHIHKFVEVFSFYRFYCLYLEIQMSSLSKFSLGYTHIWICYMVLKR